MSSSAGGGGGGRGGGGGGGGGWGGGGGGGGVGGWGGGGRGGGGGGRGGEGGGGEGRRREDYGPTAALYKTHKQAAVQPHPVQRGHAQTTSSVREHERLLGVNKDIGFVVVFVFCWLGVCRRVCFETAPGGAVVPGRPQHAVPSVGPRMLSREIPSAQLNSCPR